MAAGERKPVKSFRDLIVWQKAVDAADLVLELTETEPLCRRFWLCSQVGDSAASISANISEGHDSGTRKNYLRHLFIARGSRAETLTFLEIIRRRRYSEPQQLAKVTDLLEDVGRLLNALINALEKAGPDE